MPSIFNDSIITVKSWKFKVKELKVLKTVESLKSKVESLVRGNRLSFMILKARLSLSTFNF